MLSCQTLSHPSSWARGGQLLRGARVASVFRETLGAKEAISTYFIDTSIKDTFSELQNINTLYINLRVSYLYIGAPGCSPTMTAHECSIGNTLCTTLF